MEKTPPSHRAIVLSYPVRDYRIRGNAAAAGTKATTAAAATSLRAFFKMNTALIFSFSGFLKYEADTTLPEVSGRPVPPCNAVSCTYRDATGL